MPATAFLPQPIGHVVSVLVKLVNKSGCNMRFIMRHGDAALDAASDSVRPDFCGCDESA